MRAMETKRERERKAQWICESEVQKEERDVVSILYHYSDQPV